MGKIAARMILHQIERGIERVPVEETILETMLIKRASSTRKGKGFGKE